MNEILAILLILFIFICVLFILKIYIVYKNVNRAIDYIYSQENWLELQSLYLYNIYSIININTIRPLKWTYKQMFSGLEVK